MTQKGQNNHEEFWKQAVQQEGKARRDFEQRTGDYVQAKFFQGNAREKFNLSIMTGERTGLSPLGNKSNIKLFEPYARQSVSPQKLLFKTSSPRDLSPENRSKTELKNITVFHRHNRQVPVYERFDISPYKQVFNPDRMEFVTSADALVDAYQTITPYKDPLWKDPAYQDATKRSTREHDLKQKVIHDYSNRLLIKVDENYGKMNGGLYLQSTFNHPDLFQTIQQKKIVKDRSSSLAFAANEIINQTPNNESVQELKKKQQNILRQMMSNEKLATEILSKKLHSISQNM